MTDTTSALITGVVLAGGQARRMGGEDKGLVTLNGRAMIGYVLDILGPQVADILINANRNIERYQTYGYRVISDLHGDFSGPLAGMAAAMRAASTPYIVTVPCDSPLLPKDLVARLYRTLQHAGAEISVAHDGNRMQPVFALLQCSLLSSLEAFLDRGERKIDQWYAQHRVAQADFSAQPEAFINVNTPIERDALAARLA